MNKLAIVGMGLMGASLGMAARRRGLAREVCGSARREETRRAALAAGAADSVVASPEEAVEGAEMAVFCLPVLAIPDAAARCAGRVAPGCAVTDVGSTKSVLQQAMERALGSRADAFVGSHPIAGSERSGLEAARADLYEGATVVVTPAAGRGGAPAVRAVCALWEALGARVTQMSPGEHDALLARTSHLPHVAAAALAHMVLGSGAGRFCGGGFRDATRVAAGPDDVWHDILKTNAGPVAEALREFAQRIEEARGWLERGDFEALRRRLREAGELRRAWGEGAGDGE
jgi:prephenate dehydrogenase